MRIFRILLLSFVCLSLIGCATKHSLELSEDGKANFYEPPKDKILASLYLTCGKFLLDGEYGKWNVPDESPSCSYIINGKKYSEIQKGEVGRIDIVAGKLSIEIISVDPSLRDPVRTLEVRPNEKVLLVADYNHFTIAGTSFGLVGMAAAAIYEKYNPPEKKLRTPLTIYKNDFMNQISMKAPIKLLPVGVK
jgi:hypothetical protein